MALATASTLISRALQLAGDVSLSTHAFGWLNDGLRDLYRKGSWAFLSKWYGPYTLTVGSTYLDFGGGSNTADSIARIHRIAIAEPTSGRGLGEVDLETPSEVGSGDVHLFLPTDASGLPSKATLEQTTVDSAFRLHWTPLPGLAYRIGIYAQKVPAALGATSSTPTYPNDETLVQMLAAKALFHQEDPRADAAEAKFHRLVSEDRVVYGIQPRRLELSRRRFRR
jgi:hypothetical protein